MMRALEDQKKVLAHRVEGKSFVYRAVLNREEYAQASAADLCDRVFGGSIPLLVHNLLGRQRPSLGLGAAADRGVGVRARDCVDQRAVGAGRDRRRAGRSAPPGKGQSQDKLGCRHRASPRTGARVVARLSSKPLTRALSIVERAADHGQF